MADVPSLIKVLELLASGIGAGAVIAFLFEKVAPFQRLSPEAKWWVILVLSVGLPVAAEAVLQLVPPDILISLEPWWRALAAGFLTWAGSQAAHKIFNRPSP